MQYSLKDVYFYAISQLSLQYKFFIVFLINGDAENNFPKKLYLSFKYYFIVVTKIHVTYFYTARLARQPKKYRQTLRLNANDG